ncbi:hypothetical protein J8L98_13625 [Pseudoalteromonas sp. MMG013]|uniref:hypothetical protein n=1 Tax=Pseudoalteromonas sp. MMG013 TaxID=2822687 RepID=UPI001B38028D|nr:hypothetical protein [Pseudoalteromonas sp. MMG013]MBQ4862731.1 hypothetical protein [Pseudoalteromonas sp. MMG013]
MKKLLLSAIIGLALTSNIASANTNTILVDHAKQAQLVETLKSNAIELGITEAAYVRAIQRYESFMTHIMVPEYTDEQLLHIKRTDELPAFISYLNGVELTTGLAAEFLSQKNENDANLASYLGLKVSQLQQFIALHSNNSNQLFKPNAHNGDADVYMDKYEVHFTCRADCQGFGLDSLDLHDFVRLSAMLQNYSGESWYKDVDVSFYNKSGNQAFNSRLRVRKDGAVWQLNANQCDEERCGTEP